MTEFPTPVDGRGAERASVTEWVNLTPHDIHVVVGTVVAEVIPRSGQQARCAERVEQIDTLKVRSLPVSICVMHYGEVDGLPAPVPGTVYVVSRMVAEACPERGDLMWPVDFARDPDGKIIGCRGFGVIKG